MGHHSAPRKHVRVYPHSVSVQFMKRLFTFLGTGKYQETSYVLGDKEFTTPHFSLALREWFSFDEVTFFLTPEARIHENWSKTEAAFLQNNWKFTVVEIPTGQSEQELWEIFDRLTHAADPGDAVSFDVTHGLRSLPLLGLLAGSFLRRVLKLDLEAIYYGAFEARDDHGRTKVFDLTPFLDLLQWLSGVEQFVETGDSRQLAALIREVQGQARRSGAPDPPQKLISLAGSLQNLSMALALSRPLEVGDGALQCLSRLDEVNTLDLSRGYARPLIPLMGPIQQTYAPLQDKTPRGQAALVQWYLERGHTLQAVTLAREWMVGVVCRLFQLDEKEEKTDRKQAEDVLNHAAFQKMGSFKGEPSPLLPDFLQSELSGPLIKQWSVLIEVRNDLAHCGFRRQSLSGCKILSIAERVGQAVVELALLEESLPPSMGDQVVP